MFGTAAVYMEADILRAVVSNNIFNNHLSPAAAATSSMTINVGNNVINSRISDNKFTSIYNTNVAGGSMRVIDLNTATATSNDTVYNNMITDVYTSSNATNTNWPIGIFIEGTTGGVKIWHNSINFYGPHGGVNSATAGSACILVTTTGTNLDIRNNVLANTYDNTGSTTEKSYTIYSTAAAGNYSAMDFNDYYVLGTPNIMGFIGSDRTNIAGMQAGFGNNTHSVAVNPGFLSATDLHITPAVMSPLESGGVALGINTDIDGQVRPGPIPSPSGGGVTPDMGADEFDGIIQDVVPPAITYTPLTGGCGVGDRTFTATITDATGVNSTTFRPRVYYKRSTDLTWSFQAGTFVSGSTWSFTI